MKIIVTRNEIFFRYEENEDEKTLAGILSKIKELILYQSVDIEKDFIRFNKTLNLSVDNEKKIKILLEKSTGKNPEIQKRYFLNRLE
jgi:hypothetical protein